MSRVQERVARAGSVTKPFSGVLLANMSLRGEVGLDDPVTLYCPGELAAA
jgi:CubicO group peptidase (beta-lactamase class C family)